MYDDRYGFFSDFSNSSINNFNLFNNEIKKITIHNNSNYESILELQNNFGVNSNNKDFSLFNSYDEEKRHDSKQNENPELCHSPGINLESVYGVFKDKEGIDFLEKKTERSQEEEPIIKDNNNNSIKKEITNQSHGLIQLGGNAEVYKGKETKINDKKKQFITFTTEKKDFDEETLLLREDNKMKKIKAYIFDSFKNYINFLLEIRNKKWNIRNKDKKEKKNDKLCELEANLINQNNKIEDNIKLWDNTLEEIYTKNKISAKEKKPFNNNTEIIKSIYKKDKNENDEEVKELRIAFKLKFCELHQIFIKEISHELKEKIVGLKHLNKHFNNMDDFYEYLKIQFCYKNNKFVEKYINEPCIGINDLCLNFYNWFAKKSPKQK